MPDDKLRAGLIASVKIAQKDLGLDDATYRSLLQAVTRQDSAARCTVPQLKAMLAELRAKGWSPRPRNVPQNCAPCTPRSRPCAPRWSALCPMRTPSSAARHGTRPGCARPAAPS